LSSSLGDDGPISAEAEGEIRRKRQLDATQLTALGHIENGQKQQRFVRRWVSACAVDLEGRQFM
jgi:hypothetical protein